MTQTYAIVPQDVIGAVLYWPPFTLAFALVIAGIVVVLARRTRRTAPRDRNGVAEPASFRYAAERRAVGVVAAVLVFVHVAEFVIRGYVLTGPEVWWWRIAVPLVCATAGLGAVLVVVIARGSAGPMEPVTPTARRTWTSFSGSRSMIAASLAVLALIATTVGAGLASTPDATGQYVSLSVPIPNEPGVDPIRMEFYGWTYGVPVLVALAALLLVAWPVLHRNAARPFLRSDTVAAERLVRRETATHATLILASATMLSLGDAWRLVASGGSMQSLGVTGQNGGADYDAAWRYAELAVMAGWCAPIIETIALSVLLVIAARNLMRTSAIGRTVRSQRTNAEQAFAQ